MPTTYDSASQSIPLNPGEVCANHRSNIPENHSPENSRINSNNNREYSHPTDINLSPRASPKRSPRKSMFDPEKTTTHHPGVQNPAPVTPLKTFGDISSIRGVQNIFRAETPFIRILWITFVVSSTCLLAVSSFILIVDYLSYKTAWHTRIIPDEKTAFPSITMCAHNPFSLEANHIWHAGQVPSPKTIKGRFAALSIRLLEEGNYDLVPNFALSDSIEMYYANLNASDTIRVGHGSEMFPHCMLMHETHSVVAEKCRVELDTSIRRRSFSHPKYFNCWTIEGQEDQSTVDLIRLIVLVHLVPSKEIVEANSTFVMDTFTRGEGIRVVVHEPGTYPEVDKYGFNVQPSRMNEIVYDTVRWQRMATPIAPCSNQLQPIKDLDQEYSYTPAQCMEVVLQEHAIAACGCMNIDWPRPVKQADVVERVPYCSTMPNHHNDSYVAMKLFEQLKCLADLFEGMKQIKEHAVSTGRCIPRCDYYTYSTDLSITSWDPSPYKLASYTLNYRQIEQMLKQRDNLKANSTVIRALIDNLNRSIQGQEASINLPGGGFEFDEYNRFGDGSFTYISLIRKRMDITLQEERLVFDSHILLSRIGGLCSLCIGLTMAFFIEIIEYAYVIFHSANDRYNRRREEIRNRAMNSHPNPISSGSLESIGDVADRIECSP